jgi:hypothetical protein
MPFTDSSMYIAFSCSASTTGSWPKPKNLERKVWGGRMWSVMRWEGCGEFGPEQDGGVIIGKGHAVYDVGETSAECIASCDGPAQRRLAYTGSFNVRSAACCGRSGFRSRMIFRYEEGFCGTIR